MSRLVQVLFAGILIHATSETIAQLECPIATTVYGRVLGKRVVTATPAYCSFLGIYYGKDTSGDQRFRPPQRIDPWPGIRSAIIPGPICPQYPFSLFMSEDCLLLNIHTQPFFNRGPLRPVLVWIHGGEFRYGDGNALTYGPKYFMRHNIVIVTMQYRLTAFGFLNVNIPEASGNMGLKDQVLALHWIKENIEAFGGDPDQVTIFGQSAGAAAITAHILSPKSQGLFKRAIAMSGSILSYRLFNTNPELNAFKLGIQLGINTTDSIELVRRIKTFNFLQILNAVNDMETADNFQRGYNNYIPFVASIDDVYLPRHPIDILKSGVYNDIPLIIGYTNLEGIRILEQLQGHNEYLTQINENFEGVVVPNDILENRSAKAMMIKKFYFGDKAVTTSSLAEYFRMATDSWYVHPTDYYVRLKTASGKMQPVYYYEFSFDGIYAFYKTYLDIRYPGVCHADDLGYLWKSIVLILAFDPTGASMKVRDRHIQMFVNFATEGNPTPVISELTPIKWQPVHYPNMRYMDIGEQLKMVEESPHRNATILWQDIYNYNRI